MVQIVRPGESAPQGRAQIDGSTAGRGQIAIGRELLSTGSAFQQSNQLNLARQMSALVDAEGKRLFEESKRAHQSATLLNKKTEATERFLLAKQERFKSSTDENGNPTFQNLHEDVESSGKEILEETANSIIDPEVANAFRDQFGNYIANQKISALKEGLRQQERFAAVNLDKNLAQIVQQAITDDVDQLATYEQQGIQAINEAFQGGLISPEKYAQLLSEFKITIREGSIQNDILRGSGALSAQLLSQSAEELGIPEETKQKLERTLVAKKTSDAAAAAKAQEINEIDQINEESRIVDKLKQGIETDTLREDELLSMQDKIDSSTFTSLKKQYLAAAKKRAKERKEIKEIGLRIVKGEDIGDLTSGKINKYYDYLEAQAADTLGRTPTLQESAELAATIPTAVPRVAKRLESAVKFGSLENAEQTLAAYTYLKDRNKPTLDSGFDKEATLIMEFTNTLVEKAGLQPQQALSEAREKISSVDDQTRTRREKLFRAEKDFKAKNIEETAATELDAESFFGTNRISQDAVNTFEELTREGYVKSGSKDTAIAYAKELMAKNYGFSEVTKDKIYMFNPPEKAYPNVSPNDLRYILETEVAGSLPEGISPEDVSLSSDDITAGQIQIVGTQDGEQIKRNIPTWTVTYTKEGIEVPLLDEKTGQPKRWTPLGTTALQDRQTQAVEQAKAERQEFLQDTQINIQELKSQAPKQASNVRVQRAVAASQGTAQSHLDLAQNFLGLSEKSTIGRQTLAGFFKSSMGEQIDPAKTPWCAAFANSVLEAKGVAGTGSLAARSFLNWGESTNSPVEGDIVVLSRGSDPSKGHVGFFSGFTSDGQIKILGGNQNDKVSVKAFSRSRLLGFRKAPKAEEIRSKAGDL